jgi:hypothetical protein
VLCKKLEQYIEGMNATLFCKTKIAGCEGQEVAED